ncbi:glycoside hydrolase family 76 protein [Mucilaginibacter pocheonensis]|uniref:Alpha-1,6-mannanase (GH76 family) n=1 Tax=Mucilaginibacter pocheonensis TaxID=398050 RepID=A0ABU1T5P9_9SPHI|nr:glycoside hydrolase family 76 protein [Mucilaginibacter pocheonensis]MDR6940719.1 putative alpha-1,6-mannanase (GH76 family) [Mucilaginibacter pocheonensis]
MSIQKFFVFVILGSCIALLSCSKAKYTPPTTANTAGNIPLALKTSSPSNNDLAELAYSSFNAACLNPNTNLYYSTTNKDGIAAIWTQAIYWDMAMDAYNRTKQPAQLAFVNAMYQGGFNQYDGYNWNNTTTWFIYDDMMWWIMALARANQLTGNAAYLQKAQAGFDHVWAGSYDPVDGGMFWDFNHSGKNSCINFPTVIAAMRLYKITGDQTYLTKAQSIYAWSKANLTNTATGQVYDNKIGSNPPGGQAYTYNAGTAIGAAYALYKQSNNSAYLEDAKRYADYVKNNLCTDGILPAEGDFNEQGVMKAIFADYMMQLINEGGQTQYLSWIKGNITTGWLNRDRARNLTYRNYAVSCPTGYIQSYEASSLVTFMQLFPENVPLFPPGVTFYANTLYGGASTKPIPKGSYTLAQLQKFGFADDWASSASVPVGWKVTMYSEDKFQGTSWQLNADTPHFPNLSPTANDVVSSVKIE